MINFASKKTLAASLGLSAGVMLYVSFVEIFRKSQSEFENAGSAESDAYLYATLCFFGGFLSMLMIDKLVHMLDPDGHCHLDFDKMESIFLENSTSVGVGVDIDEGDIETSNRNVGDVEEERAVNMTKDLPELYNHEKENLRRMGLVTALAIAIHNFPEGLATFVATLDDPAVGAALAIAIAIHNIPEGICVSMPVYFATGDKNKAFLWAALSGASEILAAGLGWIILSHVVSSTIYAILFGLVAGMMVNICAYQLIPTAHKYDPSDSVVSHSILIGMIIMAISLVSFLY